MSIVSGDGLYSSDDRKLELFHLTRGNPKKVVCIKDDPAMEGFGRKIKKGDIVEINGTTHQYFGFAVAVSSECAFYDYTHFAPAEEFFN